MAFALHRSYSPWAEAIRLSRCLAPPIGRMSYLQGECYSPLPVINGSDMMKANNQKWVKIAVLGFCLLIMPALLLLLAIHPAGAATPKHYTDLQFGPPPAVKIPEYKRFQLANGLVVYLMEDHELPLVGGTAVVRTGDRLEPDGQIGLADLTGKVMRSGGTQTHPAEALNQQLEQKAASVEVSIGETSGSVSFNALSENLDEVFGLFAEVMQQPAFAAEKLALAKVQEQGQIARRNDDPDDIVGREFGKLLYGGTSPYARTVEYVTLDRIDRPDLVNFYQQYFRPNQILLGIVGDFDSTAMRSRIEAKFANWNPPTVAAQFGTTIPAVSAQANPSGIFAVNQPQLTQSYINVGHLDGQLNSPDYPALSVMNEVLSGFGGRLFNEIRSRQGLAYSVYASWQPQFDYPGTFVAGGQTRSDATVPFIRSLLSEIAKIRTQPITAAELKSAKDSVLNSFIFMFQTPSQTLSRLLRYEYFGYPLDFIFQYRQAVEKTAIADIQRVANTYLKPANLVTLVVGNQAEIKPPLSSLGVVKAIDVTIPAPKSVPKPQ
jgi:zinc protease